MNGVLIYTASGDSEGSMGGLVRQGQPGNLETIVNNAIENARWCSSDPICIDSIGQGPNSCNLAACHNCALLPETCCEESNMLLDRAMLIGTLNDPELGYFNFRWESYGKDIRIFLAVHFSTMNMNDFRFSGILKDYILEI